MWSDDQACLFMRRETLDEMIEINMKRETFNKENGDELGMKGKLKWTKLWHRFIFTALKKLNNK